ncbi:uncharacterized protein LOC125370420 [Ricinus communis]|uniref:uncharacterized protein LOC125370420 n=1 Tax=Ricinus communis TaxID=3988 RepID=UPI00201A5F0C|nr:uncharacterized protein LOC125370420 [Ricinus communis]
MLAERQVGTLPKNTESNPREHVKAITLQSSKQLSSSIPILDNDDVVQVCEVLKEILSNKRKLEDLAIVTLNEECLAILQNKLPKKKHDPGSFTIPCVIGDLTIKNALPDLGACINLIMYSLFTKLGLGETKPTRTSIQLADRTVKYPRSIVEDVLVKVDKFIFPVDFVIMDMDGESNVPLVLAMFRIIIDVYDGKLGLRVGDETITFDLNNSMRQSLDHDDKDEHELSNESVLEQLAFLLANEPSKNTDKVVEIDVIGVQKLRPSLEEPTVFELKELQKHLNCAYLDEDNKFPIILAADLTLEERERTLAFLRKYQKAFSWKIDDILGISPSYCSHKILMKDSYKPMVVPKKGGMTVVKNEKDELILTRTAMAFRVTSRFPLHLKTKRRQPSLANMAFKLLKEKLTTAPIMVSPNWELPFELLCDSSDFAIGVVLGQRRDKKFRPIYYASKTLTDAQEHYTTTEKELLVVVFAFDKFRYYLVLSKTVEFDIEIKDKKGTENLAVDHLSRLENATLEALYERAIDNFSNEFLCSIQVNSNIPWFFDFVNYLVAEVLLKGNISARDEMPQTSIQAVEMHAKDQVNRDSGSLTSWMTGVTKHMATP